MDWGIRFTQAPAKPTYDSFDPADCLNAIVSWPTDDTPRIAMVDCMDAYTDSNWGPQDASRPKPGETRTNVEMYSLLRAAVTYMGGPLDWRSVREKQASQSVCESEIRGMDEGTKMVLALRHLFEDFGATHLSAPTPILYSDNQGGVAWARSEAITKKLHHVNLREVAVRDSICTGAILLGHIPGKLNPSDIFTKEMKDVGHFHLLRSAFMSHSDLTTELGARGVLD
jgi:hypothetical protein